MTSLAITLSFTPKEGSGLSTQINNVNALSVARKLGNPVLSAYLQSFLLNGARLEDLAGLPQSLNASNNRRVNAVFKS